MPQPLSYTTFATLSGNGSTSAVAVDSMMNEITLYNGATQTWGSGTITLEASIDGTTWVSTGKTWTAGTANTQLDRVTAFGQRFRLTLSGSTTPTLNFSMKVEEMRKPRFNVFSFTANANTDPFNVSDEFWSLFTTTEVNKAKVVPWLAVGTWGSGTMSLQVSPDSGTTWFTVDTATANAYKATAEVTDVLCRFSLTGATSPALTVLVAV